MKVASLIGLVLGTAALSFAGGGAGVFVGAPAPVARTPGPLIVTGPPVIVGGPPVIVHGPAPIVRGPAPIVGGPLVIVHGPGPIAAQAILGHSVTPITSAPIMPAPVPRVAPPMPPVRIWVPGHWVEQGNFARFIPGAWQIQ